jgi:hypothetical protein
MSDYEKGDFNLEHEKIELERQRIQAEFEKLKTERFKVWWTGLSILVPLLVAAITLGFSAWNQAQQAQSQFELKVAEIVMSEKSSVEASNKAKAFAKLFPNRLPAGFAETFDPYLFGGPPSAPKKELLKLILEHRDQKQEIIKMWGQLFPEDEWVKNLNE